MYDIITFGSAITDIFLRLKKESYQIHQDNLEKNKALCFSLGSKFFIDRMKRASGGGGTNTACTFANQGFKVAFCGKIGRDRKGKAILKELKDFGVGLKLVKRDKRHPTAFSLILSPWLEERTILMRRGACHYFSEKDIPWQKIKKTKWFYLAPLNGQSAKVSRQLVEFAEKNGIKTAVNLGKSQLKLDREILGSILRKINVLILNIEEAALLSGLAKEKEKEIIKELVALTPAIVVITKGKNGSIVSDNRNFYEAGIVPAEIIEKTGAGDAFGSGFVSGFLEKNDIEYAVQLATANAAGCISKIGAKNGLLKKKEKTLFDKVIIKKSIL